MKLLIKNGRVLDPSINRDGIYDILIKDNIIEQVAPTIDDIADDVIDATDCFVMPGLIDLHVHLREPGFEHKETIETGGKSAAKGGFTTICAMPNTKPVTDNREVVEYIVNKAKQLSPVNVLPVGAITIGQAGEKLADFEGMIKAGICALSEDGKSVMNVNIYTEAMEEAKRLNIPIMAHCEDKTLVGKGAINAGEKAIEFNVEGITNDVEDVITIRDIILAEKTGAKLHLCHVSTAGAVYYLEEAKKRGAQVSGEACPHHFTLTQDDITTPDTNYKMNPPLRSNKDKEAIIRAIKEGVIEVISTDHAPHHRDEKAKSLAEAPFGIIGLETAVSLTITELLNKSIISPLDMARLMSYNPARVIGIDKGTLNEGKIADITIINPKDSFIIAEDDIVSKSKNTPFIGREVTGRVYYTIVGGKVVYSI